MVASTFLPDATRTESGRSQANSSGREPLRLLIFIFCWYIPAKQQSAQEVRIRGQPLGLDHSELDQM